MRKIISKMFLLVAIISLLTSCQTIPRTHYRDKTLYTRVNIWYEPRKQGEILSTNYHHGQILPAGTCVHVIKVKSDRIHFETIDPEQSFRLYYIKEYTVVPMAEYFDRMFSETNLIKKMSLTKDELNAIQTGEVVLGMSKEAVLVSYGYPPAHQTPHLSSNAWRYWIGRFNTRIIKFCNGKVVKNILCPSFFFHSTSR